MHIVPWNPEKKEWDRIGCFHTHQHVAGCEVFRTEEGLQWVTLSNTPTPAERGRRHSRVPWMTYLSTRDALPAMRVPGGETIKSAWVQQQSQLLLADDEAGRVYALRRLQEGSRTTLPPRIAKMHSLCLWVHATQPEQVRTQGGVRVSRPMDRAEANILIAAQHERIAIAKAWRQLTPELHEHHERSGTGWVTLVHPDTHMFERYYIRAQPISTLEALVTMPWEQTTSVDRLHLSCATTQVPRQETEWPYLELV
jgi:hypothetical protein